VNRAEKRRHKKRTKKGQGKPADLKRAMRDHAEGRLGEAEQVYRQILNTEPDHPIALHLSGVIAHQNGDNDSAVALITKALAIKSNVAEAHANLGNALQDLAKLDDAAASYRRALEIKPDYLDALNNLGITLMELGQPGAAGECYRKAIALDPNIAAIHGNLAHALKDLGDLDAAVAGYQTAIALNPAIAETHNSLGIALKDLGRLEDAATSYRQALNIKPNHARAHFNLGNALQLLGQMDDAAASYDTALALKPDDADTLNNLGNVHKNLGRLDDAAACYRQALTIQPDFPGAERNLLSLLMAMPGLSPGDIFTEHVRAADRHQRALSPSLPAPRNDADPDRTLRIGYLSTETDADIAAMVRADAIDVLVCLAGHFDSNRPLVCARRQPLAGRRDRGDHVCVFQ